MEPQDISVGFQDSLKDEIIIVLDGKTGHGMAVDAALQLAETIIAVVREKATQAAKKKDA
jgi:GGDEF domain-containing protein